MISNEPRKVLVLDPEGRAILDRMVEMCREGLGAWRMTETRMH